MVPSDRFQYTHAVDTATRSINTGGDDNKSWVGFDTGITGLLRD